MTNETSAPDEQLPGLARAALKRTRSAPKRPVEESALVDPVANVLVDVALAHLDREFDYSVPQSMDALCVPGVRVKVRFAGREVGGFVVRRTAHSPHVGRLTPIRRVVSSEPVLSAEIATLADEVARRYAGTRSDVLRLAVPPRHARVEAEELTLAPVVGDRLSAGHAAWGPTDRASAFLNHLADGQSPRAVWGAAPGDDWPMMLACAAAVVYSRGRGVLVCVPDGRDTDRVDAALSEVLGPGHHVALRADVGPAARYRDFLSVSRGARQVVVGTRSAGFAPVADLGLVVIWDDGDDSYAEPRAPYPHLREVLLTRARLAGAGVLVGGFARSVEAQMLLTSGWAHEIGLSRAGLRERVSVSASSAEVNPERDPHGHSARIPRVVYDAIRDGLKTGPVLVHTPRGGYAPSLACAQCRSPARCRACSGPLSLRGSTSAPACSWCGTVADSWECPVCGNKGLRAPVVGGRRTSEELGKVFPGVLVRTSDREHVVAEVAAKPMIVVATPGAEPQAIGGYSSVVLLDTWLPLARTDLRTNEEAVRRWFNAAGLVRAGGTVMVVGESTLPAIQALVRWDPAGFAVREAEERAMAHLPPAARVATIVGDPGAVDDAVTLLAAPDSAEILGPAPTGNAEEVRVVVRVPWRDARALSEALGELQRLRSVRKLDPVRIQVDPVSL